MGKKKKPTISKMKAKTGSKKSTTKKTKAEVTKDQINLGISSPNLKDEKVINIISKMKVLTPFTISKKFNIFLSTAKKFLRDLEKTGHITFVSKSKNTIIYKPAKQKN